MWCLCYCVCAFFFFQSPKTAQQKSSSKLSAAADQQGKQSFNVQHSKVNSKSSTASNSKNIQNAKLKCSDVFDTNVTPYSVIQKRWHKCHSIGKNSEAATLKQISDQLKIKGSEIKQNNLRPHVGRHSVTVW